jgi:hypothetical protein
MKEREMRRSVQAARQGTAQVTTRYRDTGPARGPVSPLGGSGGPEETLHRDEDFASAPMERLAKNTIPEVNKRAGVTTIAGQRAFSQVQPKEGNRG